MPALLIAVLLGAAQGSPSADALFDAARRGDAPRVARLLDAGADVNARARYDMTALAFAADKGHLDVVRLLAERGAALDVADTFYKARAIDLALGNGHRHVARYLVERGSTGAGAALNAGIRAGDVDLVRSALASPHVTPQMLAAAAELARRETHADILRLVTAAAAARPVEAAETVIVPDAVLQRYAGTYRSEEAGFSLTVAATGNSLTLTLGQDQVQLTPTSETAFRAVEVENLTVTFNGRGGLVESMTVVQNGRPTVLARAAAAAPGAATAPAGEATMAPTREARSAPRAKPAPWPSFRGPNASGVADGQGAVASFDVAAGTNVLWKTPIPGIAVSSPIIWGDRVFVTTAIGDGDTTFRTGLYGDVKPVDDLSTHTWRIYAADRRTGAILWQRDVFTGAPQVKRHTKSSQANSTPATDGRHVVAVFGTIGLLVCYDADGTKLWQRDIGVVDNGWFLDPSYQWGHSSSPIIHGTSVIVQVDQQRGSFIGAFDLATGKPVWRTERPDEISTWATPTVVSGPRGDEIVTNGTKIRGYDAATGRLLWTLGPNSEITVGTPVAGQGVVYVTGGYPPVRPVYAVRAGASGDISLPKGDTSSQAIAWSNDREGTYIPTPLLYRGILYTLNSNGILTAYDAGSGERLYRARVGGGGAFAASPVAADGRIYLASEDGDVYVVRAGRAYTELGTFPTNEVIMATPAIADGVMVIRTLGHLLGVGGRGSTPGSPR